MTCKDFIKLLANDEVSKEMQFHADACTSCRRLLADMQRMDQFIKVPEKPKDSKALWSNIQNAIAKETPSGYIEKIPEKPRGKILAFAKITESPAQIKQWGVGVAVAAILFLGFGIGFYSSDNGSKVVENKTVFIDSNDDASVPSKQISHIECEPCDNIRGIEKTSNEDTITFTVNKENIAKFNHLLSEFLGDSDPEPYGGRLYRSDNDIDGPTSLFEDEENIHMFNRGT